MELYNLATDPHEQHNLAQSDPEKLHEMESRLADFESRLVPRAEVQVQISAAERRTLASLGYAGGASGAAVGPAPANLPDVKPVFDSCVPQLPSLSSVAARHSGVGTTRSRRRHSATGAADELSIRTTGPSATPTA